MYFGAERLMEAEPEMSSSARPPTEDLPEGGYLVMYLSSVSVEDRREEALLRY